MNILIDVVPDTVEIDGVEYEINTDFRISIMFELLMQDKDITDKQKLDIAINLYYPEIPHDYPGAIKNIIWFYSCGRDLNEVQGDNKDTSRAEEIYSFEHDDEYIYSAFLDQYGIDLQDIEHLHWWKFRALFRGLKEDNQISKIMGIRAVTITDDMTDADKKYYRKMKQIYALPDDRTQEEKEIDFNNAMTSMF